uniref:ATP-dependent Clp protease proteolytic subunit n=1 Tax=Atractomorpha echinata TaxID=52677 RepID=A0A140GIU5_9CHLO|nr:proteolytic subunit 2 of clp protease [Atractomorpha echinata]
MPIGVPRIIYCWGEELPAQWTDIYNFIFRRRMVFLMQYLDDELCNQICGLLINIHMEDRSKEMEKKEMERSGLFKSSNKGGKKADTSSITSGALDSNIQSKQKFMKPTSIEDLMASEGDLAIDQNYMLERHTLQKITLDWLNWNAQFFDYSEEPYLFYLAEILSKNFNEKGQLFYDNSNTNMSELPKLMTMFRNMSKNGQKFDPRFFDSQIERFNNFDVYSPFRLLQNFASSDANSTIFNNHEQFGLNSEMHANLAAKLKQINQQKSKQKNLKNKQISSFIGDVAQKEFFSKLSNINNQNNTNEKTLAQRQLKNAYSQDLLPSNGSLNSVGNIGQVSNYLNLNSTDEAYIEFRDYYRKQTERTFQEEESKKVFMIINSFGGSVGNGITVHDALQFIKAGSLTLGLGVAASAASLALAGGTIGERYVTEGCHVMIHQPEGGISGQASDIWIDSQEIMKIRLDVAEIYSLSTYRPRHKILKDLDRDFYLSATETIFYGLADEIATNEVMHEIIEMTSKVWDYHDSKQQKLLESRANASSGFDTQTQN